MKRVFTCSNSFELQAFKAELERIGVPYFVKNQYISSAVGELPFTEAWPELWVLNESDADQALVSCKKIESEMLKPKADWSCDMCGETNDGSFEYCWQCETIDRTASL